MHRIVQCPGSLGLIEEIRSAGELHEQPSAYAEAGTRIHADWAAAMMGVPSEVTITPDETETSKWLKDETQRLINASLWTWYPVRGAAHDIEFQCTVEVRLWGLTVSGNRYSGQYDFAYVNESDGVALLVDGKTGWNYVEPAETNLQLATLAVLAMENYNINDIIVAIVQPPVRKVTTARYKRSELYKAKGYIHRAVDESQSSKLFRSSVSACRYCHAKIHCPILTDIFMNISRGKLPADIATALEHVTLAEMVADEVKANAKRILENDPTAIPGWEFTKPTEVRKIKSADKAYLKLVSSQPQYLLAPQFMECCSVSVGKLERAVGDAVGAKSKDRAAALERALGDVIVKEKKAGSLVRVGGSAMTTPSEITQIIDSAKKETLETAAGDTQ